MKVWFTTINVFSVLPTVEIEEFDKRYIIKAEKIRLGGLQGMILETVYWGEEELEYIHWNRLVVGEHYDLEQVFLDQPDYYLIRAPEEIQNKFGYSRGFPNVGKTENP